LLLQHLLPELPPAWKQKQRESRQRENATNQDCLLSLLRLIISQLIQRALTGS
jgi:hypothetical protein